MSGKEEAKKRFNTQSLSLADWLKQQKPETSLAQAKPSPQTVAKTGSTSTPVDGSLKISSSGQFKLTPLKRESSASPKPTQSPLFEASSQGVWRRIASPQKGDTPLASVTPEPEKPERKGSMSDLPEEELVKLGIHLAQRHRQPSADGFNWAEDDDIEDWADDMPEEATEVEVPTEDQHKPAEASPVRAWKPITPANYVPIDQQLKEYEEKKASQQAQHPQPHTNASRHALFDDKWRGGDRYGDRHDRYGDRHGDRHDRYDRYDRYDRHDRYGDRRGRMSLDKPLLGAMRYDSYDRFSNDYHPRRELYNDQSGKVEAMEGGDARNYKDGSGVMRRSPVATRAELTSPKTTNATPAGATQPPMDAATLLAQQEEVMRQAREKAKLRKEEEQRVEEERRKAARKRAEELAQKVEARAKEKEMEARQREVPTEPSADRVHANKPQTTPVTTTNNSPSSPTAPPIWGPKRLATKTTWPPLSYGKPRLLDDPKSPEMRNGRGTSRFFPSPKSEIGSGVPWRDLSPTRLGGRELPSGLSLEPSGERELAGLAARALANVKNMSTPDHRVEGKASNGSTHLTGFGLDMPADVPISRIPPDTEYISKSRDKKTKEKPSKAPNNESVRKSQAPSSKPEAQSRQHNPAKRPIFTHKQLLYSYEMEVRREDKVEKELKSLPGNLIQLAPVSVGMYTTKWSRFKPLPEVSSIIVGSYSYSAARGSKRAVREPISILKNCDMKFVLKLPA